MPDLATLHGAATIVDVVARQLTELQDATEVGDHATAHRVALKIATTAPLAIEALRAVVEALPEIGGAS